MGLLDNMPGLDTAQGQGLLAAAFSMMGAKGNSLGNAIGDAGRTYMGESQRAQGQMDDREYWRLQMDGYKRKAEQEVAQAKEAQRIRDLIAGSARRPMGGTADVNAALPADMQIGAMHPMKQQPIDYQALIAQGVPLEMVKALAESRNFGRDKVARTADIEGPNGSKMIQGYDDYGQPVGQGANGYVTPVSVNQGDRTSFVKPTAGLSLPMGMSPSERDSSARGWASNNLQRQRLNFDMSGGGEAGVTQVGFNKQFGKAPAGYRWKADGSMEFIPGGPSDQKAQLQKSGEGTVGSVVADLRDKYTNLDAENGIVSTKNRFGTNIGAAVGASGIGQYLNGAVGTKTQSSRDSIAMTRPLLLQAIMKATGMSAKQMDSNAELKLYLATATDPQKGLEANMLALDRIEKLYGGGSSSNSGGAGGSLGEAPKANGGWSIQKAN